MSWQGVQLGSRIARRRYQQGQLIDGGDRWEARWREDVIPPRGAKPHKGDKVLPDGNILRRVRRWRVIAMKKDCPTKRMAQRILDERLRPVNREDYKPTPKGLFSEFTDRWMKTVMIHHKPSTQLCEKSHIKMHLLPAFGKFQLGGITAEVLQSWVSSLTANQKTIRNIIATLQTIWRTAKAWGNVSHNPFDSLVLPKKVRPNTYAFSLEEAIAIIEKAQEPWKTLFHIVAETGIRSGEVAGLRVQDLDPINRILSIRQSVWNRQIQTPKTENAIRREPISVELCNAIQEVIAAAKPNDYGLIFTGQTGKPLDMIHFSHILRPILKELGIWDRLQAMGIKQCGLHALRRKRSDLPY